MFSFDLTGPNFGLGSARRFQVPSTSALVALGAILAGSLLAGIGAVRAADDVPGIAGKWAARTYAIVAGQGGHWASNKGTFEKPGLLEKDAVFSIERQFVWPLKRRLVASLLLRVPVRAPIADVGRRKRKGTGAVTPSEILKALSKGHDRWPREALEAASAQRSEVGALLLEKLARAVAEIEKIAAGSPKASVKRFLNTPSPLFSGVFLLADWRESSISSVRALDAISVGEPR